MWGKAEHPKKKDVNDLVRGKVIKEIRQCWDGGNLYDILIRFTDDSELSFMQELRPAVPVVKFTRDVKIDDGDETVTMPKI